MTYNIIRIKTSKDYKTVTSKIIKRNVTLKEAQEWCSREDTKGEYWFDGYEVAK